MLFTTKEIATYFGQNEQWVYNIVAKLGIKWIKQRDSVNGICKINFYNINQRTTIENYIIEEYSKKRNKIIIIETNYFIHESKANLITNEETQLLLDSFEQKTKET